MSEPILTKMLVFSGMYSDEDFFPDGAEIVDFSDLGGVTCYCDPESERSIREALSGEPANAIHWIDSGDYHYVTLFYLEKISEPFALVLIDNHSDDQACAFDAGCLSCGSWVARARETLPRMLETHWMKDGAVPESGTGLPVYISIDKDVLSEEYYRTDWDQGKMTLPGLMKALELLFHSRRVLGVDICGGLTISKGARAEDLALNRLTDSELQDFIMGFWV